VDVEAKALNTVGEHFKPHALQTFSHCEVTVRRYHSLVHVLSNCWDPEAEDLVPLDMPIWSSITKLPFKRWLFEHIE
jgi:hypothetical protein